MCCEAKMMRRRIGLVLDDADVAVEIGNLRQAVVERDEVAEAVAGFELVELHQLIGDGDAVDLLAALLQLAHAPEDAAVLFQAEVVGLERAGGLDVEAVVEQNGAEHEALGIDIGGKTLLDGIAAQTWWITHVRPRCGGRQRIGLWIKQVARKIVCANAQVAPNQRMAAGFSQSVTEFPQAFNPRPQNTYCSYICFIRSGWTA